MSEIEVSCVSVSNFIQIQHYDGCGSVSASFCAFEKQIIEGKLKLNDRGYKLMETFSEPEYTSCMALFLTTRTDLPVVGMAYGGSPLKTGL